METLDFSKYVGTHTLKEIDGVLANIKSDILEKEKQVACKKRGGIVVLRGKIGNGDTGDRMCLCL